MIQILTFRSWETLETMLRAYIRRIPGLTIAAQEKLADEGGVPKKARYVEPRAVVTDVRDEAIAGLRPGDVLWIADLTVLAENRSQLIALLDRKAGGLAKFAIQEGRTRRTSHPPHDGAGMVMDAYSRWASGNKTFGSMTAAEAGAKGGQMFRRRVRKEKLPAIEAKKMWRDPADWGLNKWQITEKINMRARELGYKAEWTPTSLYRAFGGRGMPAGPKMKQEK